jgi:hypothetical protein
MQHIDDGTLHALLDGALRGEDPAAADAAEAHLESCAECRARLDAAAESRRQAGEILGALGTGAAATGTVGDFEEVVARAAALAGRPVAQPGRAASDAERTQQHRHAQARRVRRTRAMAWAATLVIAVGTGWVIRDRLGPDLASSDVVSIPPVQAVAEAGSREAAEGDRGGDEDVARADGRDAPDPTGTDVTGRRVAGGAAVPSAAPAAQAAPAPPSPAPLTPRAPELAAQVASGAEPGAATEEVRQLRIAAGGAEAARAREPVVQARRADGPLGSPAPGAIDLAGGARVSFDDTPLRSLPLAARVEPLTTGAATAAARARTPAVLFRSVSVGPLEAAAAVVRYAMDHDLGRWDGQNPEVLCVTVHADRLDDLRALVESRGQAIVPAEECGLHSGSDPPLAPRVRHLATLRSALILRLGSVGPVVQPGVSAHLQIPVTWEAGHHYGGTLHCEVERRDGRLEVSACSR